MTTAHCSSDVTKPCDGGWAPNCTIRPVAPPKMKAWVDFYDPYIEGKDDQGRTLDFILSQSDDWLQDTRFYYFWLFPVTARQQADDAPILSVEAVDYVREHRRFREQIINSVIRIMWFLGFRVLYKPDAANKLEVLGPHNASQAGQAGQAGSDPYPRWLGTSFDHRNNQQRVARMIRSLRCLTMEDEARAIYDSFNEANDMYGNIVSDEASESWKLAMTRKVKYYYWM
ncbi:Diphthamide biosynthesis protein 3 [Hypoxylon texense]